MDNIFPDWFITLGSLIGFFCMVAIIVFLIEKEEREAIKTDRNKEIEKMYGKTS